VPDRGKKIRMSLSTKCQLLFGLALVLIIGAALWAPWQRMEELMRRVDRASASAVADQALALHAARHDGMIVSELTRPTTATTLPTTLPAGASTVRLPRVVGLPSTREERLSNLNGFERRALDHFLRDSEAEYFERSFERSSTGDLGYRLATPVYAAGDCIRCHTVADARRQVERTRRISDPASAQTVPPVFAAPATGPATRPAPQVVTGGQAGQSLAPPLLGMVVVEMTSNAQPSQQLLNRVFFLAAGLAAGALAVVVFSAITSKFILRPVRILQETAEKVSGGDLNIRSSIHSGDEFEQLSNTFNTMLTNLKHSNEQLQSLNRSLDVKLEQLAQTNVALYESNRLKSQFLANVSHELKTPLGAILGFAELLRDGQAGPQPMAPEKSTRYTTNIITAGRSLLELITELLDLARIEAGRMQVQIVELVLMDLFEGIPLTLKPLLEQQQLTLQTSVAPDVPILKTDKGKLLQVLYNLLSNAIKFSPNGETVTMRASMTPTGRVRIEVIDRGPGIEKEQQKMIFEKFRQLDGSMTRKHGGTGLGLAISKELVRLLDGQIGVTSVPGEGAMFWIELPVESTGGEKDVVA
jgi:signal transduction histidine kinase